MDSYVLKHIDAEVVLFLKLAYSLVHILAEGVHIRHGKCSESPQTHKFPALLFSETVAGHFDHPQWQVLVGDRHVVVHKELPETGCKAQKHLPLVRLNRILPCREPVKVLFERRVIHVVHQGSFDFHCPEISCDIKHVVFNKGFDKPSFRVIAHVP
ncbi:hypothetical protein SDC9_180782 [bioreactor metagenome]|uniref:Uncharacterized protein n=1 Tax=bioreactor metagenome TaxID=1076179 RepID=A0A645H2Q0_9ZZZZ